MIVVDSLLALMPTKRATPVAAVILHQTGETDLDKIIRYYTSNADRIAPHYMVEVHGSVRRFVTEDRIAYHAKIDPQEAQLYSRGYQEWSTWEWSNGKPEPRGLELSNYVQWREQWRRRGYQSPLDLVTRSRPNALSVGIEIQKPLYPTKKFFEAPQYKAAAELVFEVCKRHKLPVDREHVLIHYDVSPMRRSNKQGSWDPPSSFDYNLLWDEMRGL